ncbi:MAG: hypothetical protein JXN64_04430 [Spirochaetes bacterium]|nr:hypothetical protein [Spirochaetota bacterium]
MEKTIDVINRLLKEGLIINYAVGGGIGALFYIEPFATFHLDIFIIFPKSSGILISLSPIYNWLDQQGYKTKKEQVIIEGIPVQFIPVYNDLIRESVQNSVQKNYSGSKINVLLPEYLIAIMVQTFRSKDKERIIRMMNESEIDKKFLDKILSKYNLKSIFDSLIGH